MEGVLRDVETSALNDRDKALFRFVGKVNHDLCNIGPPDIDVLHQAGWDDEAIYDAITVCAMFNFYNRWIDATGVHALTDEQHKAGALRMKGGYLRE